MMGISAWQIIIVLLIVVLLFGTKKLRGMGGDLGEAIKGFKNGMKDIPEDTVESIEQKQQAQSSMSHEPTNHDALDPSMVEKTSSTN